MADDDHVDAHRFQIPRGVDERLAFENARSGRGDIHGVSREALLGELEGDSGARRVLEEEIDDRRAAQRRHFFYCALAYFLERFGGVEDETNLIGRELLEPQQVFSERPDHVEDLGTITTSVRLSSSSMRTSTRSSGPTSTVVPTTSG